MRRGGQREESPARRGGQREESPARMEQGNVRDGAYTARGVPNRAKAGDYSDYSAPRNAPHSARVLPGTEYIEKDFREQDIPWDYIDQGRRGDYSARGGTAYMRDAPDSARGEP